MEPPKLLSAKQIAEHDTPADCWVVIDGQVWDMTEFAPEHPGGAGVILRYAGHDATKAFQEIHTLSILSENLLPEKCKGNLDPSTVDDLWMNPQRSGADAAAVTKYREKPPLHSLLNIDDYAKVAQRTATKKAWAFYSSAADDLITRDANSTMYNRIWFRPRVLRNVRTVDTKTKILGCDSSLPLFVSPAAMAKLIHPDGELALARASQAKGVIQCITLNASYPLQQIIQTTTEAGGDPCQPFFFQLYVNRDRAKSEAILSQCERISNIKAIFVTVDAATAGKREADERVKLTDEDHVGGGATQAMIESESSGNTNTAKSKKSDAKGAGLTRIMGSYIDPGLCWDDISWLRKHTSLPLVLKGIMTADDAILAAQHGIDGIVLSNHGGRNLDTSPPSILVLLELRRRCPEIFSKVNIFIDGGIRRGTDVLKALCLGATAVGLGRPFLYALTYGQEGVEALIDLIHDELVTAMKLVGITSLSQVSPNLVNTRDVDHLIPTDEPLYRRLSLEARRRAPTARL